MGDANLLSQELKEKVIEEKVVEEKPIIVAKSGAEKTAKQALIGRGIAEPTDQQISDYITRMGLE